MEEELDIVKIKLKKISTLFHLYRSPFEPHTNFKDNGIESNIKIDEFVRRN